MTDSKTKVVPAKLPPEMAEAVCGWALSGPYLNSEEVDDIWQALYDAAPAPASAVPQDVVACCEDCGELYSSDRFPDLVIDNAAFAKIAPNDGLFCPNCLCARLTKAGLSDVRGGFRSGPLAAREVKGSPDTALAEARAERDQAIEQRNAELARSNLLASIIRDCPDARTLWGSTIAEETEKELAAREMTPIDLAEARAEIERLRNENFALSANQCHDGYAGEHGHHRCRQVEDSVAAEREACADLAENTTAFDDDIQRGAGCHTSGQRIAAAIRARSEPKP
ncbi:MULTISPECIES: hypothetical protein [unclassified Aurantimonas]|uniref:hypothetical protein n=1 Tax=unclassified Aurantimonas TaxID=2638230 RepID=UPI002E16E577|nr:MULTISPECIES: hypothetical protein [unclassified Aurantimonas]MEC5289438.1 hypothetical protein [Aurantimonas sp. C2-3-R2]MEC5410518.1 hypothetical protein [Aurantimonas sp. C2-4-R8]